MSERSRAYLIENGLLFTATGDKAETAPVAFEDRIVATGDAAKAWAADRADVIRIDASGATVMPGLIDAHCHISFDEPSSNDELFFHRREGLSAIVAGYNVRKILRSGVTSLFDADTIFNVSLDVRDAIEGGVIEGPRMLCGGNALFTSVGGTAGMLVPDEGAIGYLKVTRTRDEIVTEIRQQAKRGVDWIKIHVTGLIPRQRAAGEIQVWNYDELRLAADTAHELGLPIVGHCRNASSSRDAARAGFDMLLHATNMDDEALRAVCDAQVPLVPTLTFQAVLADHGQKVGSSAFLQDLFRREIDDSSQQLRLAHQSGAPLLCGTESGFSITPYGEWHWRELQVFVENIGLTSEEALQCATRHAATCLGMSDVGTIEPGKAADIIVVHGDVVADVTRLGRPGGVRHVFKNGVRIDTETPMPMRGALPSWRVSTYSTMTATRQATLGWEGTMP